MKKQVKEKKRKLSYLLILTLISVLNMTGSIFASSTSADVNTVLNGIETFKALFLGIVSLLGAFIAGKGVLDLASAISARDTTSIVQAIAMIAGGAIAFFVTGFLAIMGITTT